MKTTEARTPAEILRVEMDSESDPTLLTVSAVSLKSTGQKLVRFVLNGTEVYHEAADARIIAAGILRCADYCEGKVQS